MKLSHNILNIVLGVLLISAITGLMLTSRPPRPRKAAPGRTSSSLTREQLIDQRPLITARSLAALAATPEEEALARHAVRASDHEVDLAFTEALRAASQEPPAKKNSTIQARIDKAQSLILAFNAQIKRLTAESKKATPTRRSLIGGQMALAQAQLDLAQNELSDAQEDLARTGGDTYSRLERLWAEHQAAEHSNGATRVNTALTASRTARPARSIISRWTFWTGEASKDRQISQAQQVVLAKIGLLTGRHDALQAQIQAAVANKQAPGAQAPPSQSQTAAGAGEQRALSRLHRLSQSETELAGLDRRIQDLRELSDIYTEWSALVVSRQRAGVHLLLRSALWIVLTLLVASLASHLINQTFDRLKLERKQRMTLRGVVRFVVQMGALLVILGVVFGSPSHMSTVLGLVGAGLAVALKSFVVAFFGWFVLMGRNGIQVGDWVEINGVRGEVLEIGLLRTILLETGNWTEAGHPTGRQVAFLNSYAV
ncbi:MAG: mechanosensitive ion channel, partial [Acidobacteriota bacterium]|nr:mechanosensitive ion channel [Acidobacteriota bacterium]